MAVSSRGLALVLVLSFCATTPPSSASSDGFIQCLREKIPSELVFTQGSSSFTDVLVSSIHNPMFFTNTTVRPLFIVTPADASHVQAAVTCGRTNGVRLRVRSGGHNYEGLSYRSVRPEVFAVVDLASLRAITFDSAPPTTAWVGSGATLGELYYAVAKNNPEVAFPAGICPTIGVGGHFSGGGIGMMMRKFGLSVDNVLDAKLVNVNGQVLDRAAMGESLFWAVAGGGGESFGVVLEWKVSLVKVPPTVTAFNVFRTTEQGAVDVVTRWQEVAPTLPDELNVRVIIQRRRATFQALYLGSCSTLVPMLGALFPELGMESSDCLEMTWLQSAAFFNSWNPNAPVESLLTRGPSLSTSAKHKSDYVRRALPRSAWADIFPWLTRSGAGMIILEPHGGFMATIPDGATPYAHRRDVLYNIQYLTFWSGNDDGGSTARGWISDLYDFMGQYVTSSPREAYVNYGDLDIGENEVADDVSTFDSGKVWGEKYFGTNFQRLAEVKGMVDPTDYFRNEQSIPPLLQSN